jgi:molecular chaperone HscC
MEGYYTPIIHRNTTIPVSREEFFGTMTASQTEILLNIFQGESRRVKDNLKLGELKDTGIPAGPPGQQIGVRFTYDLNGILEVEAYIPETGRRFVTVLTNHARHMSEAEVAAAVERLRAVKFYPRDDVKNQRLLLFVERIIGEVPPIERQTLEETLTAFEAAMASGDREQFAAVRQGLLVVLSSLGIEYDDYREQPDAEN